MKSTFYVFVNIVGLLIAFYIVYQLVRVRLYVGYAVAGLILVFGALLVLDFPAFHGLIRWMAGTGDLQKAWILLILAGVVFILIYFSLQISILSTRIRDISRHIAIQETSADGPKGKVKDSQGLE